ncbi:hypothetical protein TNCV_1626651 [Trichonephila clavipes]|nr:hypothetical protein TNCV_1626651 [Trichonephila clavipes]
MLVDDIAPLIPAKSTLLYSWYSGLQKFLDCKSRGVASDSGSFAMREKGGNRLVPGPDYMVDALKLLNQAPRGSGESLLTCVVWRCSDGAQHSSVGQFWSFLVNR